MRERQPPLRQRVWERVAGASACSTANFELFPGSCLELVHHSRYALVEFGPGFVGWLRAVIVNDSLGITHGRNDVAASVASSRALDEKEHE